MNHQGTQITQIQVIHTRGSDREIGAQHAELLGTSVENGMIRYFSHLWDQLTDGAGRNLSGRFALSFFKRVIAPYLKGKLIRQIPDFAKERLEGMAARCGVPVEKLLPLLVLPDFGPVLQAMQSQWAPQRFVEFQPPAFGCSSFFVGADHFYFGRNLDFPGSNHWDRFPVIQLFDRGSGLKYLGFTSAGVPFGGISGINEAGISIALHQHFTNRFRWDGELPFFISERVLQKATSLEDAIALVSQSKVSSAWAFLIADAKARRSAIIEALPDRQSVRYWSASEAPLAHSNYLVSESCRDCETSASERMTWDNFFRRKRIEESLQSMQSHFTPDKGVRLLGDGLDLFWGEEKILNRVVSQNYNIKSFLLDLTSMKLWMAEREAPPVHLGRYSEFDLHEIFAGKSGFTGNSLPGFEFKEPSVAQAKITLIQGYIAANEGNRSVAIKRLGEALDLHFTPEVAHVRGVLLLQSEEPLAAMHDFRRAQEWIESKLKVVGRNEPPPEYFESRLFEARCLDVLRRRSDALKLYRSIAEDVRLRDSNLRNIAKRAQVYTLERARSILMPFSTYVPFQ